MRVAALVLILLLAPAAAAQGLRAAAIDGNGPFEAEARGALVQAVPGAVPWTLHAPRLSITVTDERLDARIPNPAQPGRDLVATYNRTSTTHTFTDARVLVRLIEGQDAVAILRGDGLATKATTSGLLRVRPAPAETLERSHLLGDGAVGGQEAGYEVAADAGLKADFLDHLSVEARGKVELYVWGLELAVETREGTHTMRTGEWDDGPAGAHHFVHAWVTAPDGYLLLDAVAATVRAPMLALHSGGTLAFAQATGEVPGASAHGDVTALQGGFLLAYGIDAIQATQLEAPQAWLGALRAPEPAWEVAWLAAALVLVAAAVAAAAPSLEAWRMRRRGDLPPVPKGASAPGWRAHRAEAYAAWTARAQSRGHMRLAAWLSGRAVHNLPSSPTLRVEHALLMGRRRRWARALDEHTLAHALLDDDDRLDRGTAALNALHAAMAAAHLSKADEGIEWLRLANEFDPAIATKARMEPALGLLRSHPDYGAVA